MSAFYFEPVAYHNIWCERADADTPRSTRTDQAQFSVSSADAIPSVGSCECVGCFLLSPEAPTSAVSRPDLAAETALLSKASQYPHTSASYSADSNLRRRRTKCVYVKRFLYEIVTRSRKYGCFRPGLTCLNTVLQCATQFKRPRQKNGILDRKERKIKSDEILWTK